MAVERLTVGVVASPREWRSDLQSHVRDHVSDVQLKVLREPRTAFEQQMDVVVVDDVASFLSRKNVELLRERGVRVVGVYDPDGDEGQGRQFLTDLGVDLAVTADASPDDLLRTIATLGPNEHAVHEELDRFLEELDTTQPTPRRPDEAGAHHAGSVVAIGGGGGGSGITEVSLAFATALAATGAETLALDLDTVAPTVARRLLYLLEPNVLTALDALRHKGGRLGPALGVRAPGAPGGVGFHVLPGLANVADWDELRAPELWVLIDELRQSGVHVVVDVGAFLEELDGGGRERFGAARALVSRADVLVGVCRPDPIGVLRLLDWAALAHELAPERAISVLVNRSPRSQFRRAQLEEQIRDNVDPRLTAGVWFLPEDPRLPDATWDGAPAPRGPFTRAVTGVAQGLVPVAAGRPRRARPLRPTEAHR